MNKEKKFHWTVLANRVRLDFFIAASIKRIISQGENGKVLDDGMA